MLKITNANSKKDRITFSTKNSCTTAIRKENGEIDFEFKKEDTSISQSFLSALIIWCLPLILKSFVLIPLIEKNVISIIWYLIPIFLYSIITILIIILIRNEGKEILKNHGAEHMVFSAYKKLKHIPTVEEAQKFSRISRFCGITIFSAFITSQLIGFIVFINTGFVISEIVLFAIPLFFSSFFPFNLIGKFMQFFTTSVPENINIELAIAALSALELHECKKNYFNNK